MEHAYGLEIPQRLEEILDPRRTALLVYDMQVGICAQVREAPHVDRVHAPRVRLVHGTADTSLYCLQLSLGFGSRSGHDAGQRRDGLLEFLL